MQRDHSMLTFEQSQLQGTTAIVQKLVDLPFAKVKHSISTLDAQPSSPGQGGVIVMVTGLLVVDDEQKPMNYSQVFHLLPEGGSYYVLNGTPIFHFGPLRRTTTDRHRHLPSELRLGLRQMDMLCNWQRSANSPSQ